MADTIRQSRLCIGLFAILGLAMASIGAILAYGGLQLALLGGSLYYLPTGALLFVSGLLLIWQRRAGAWLYLGVYLGTWIWAVAEAGFEFWPLAPRVIGPTILAILVLVGMSMTVREASIARSASEDAGGRASGRQLLWQFHAAAAIGLVLILVAFGVGALRVHGAQYGLAKPVAVPISPDGDAGDWLAYGKTNEGRRFAPLTQIDKDNVDQLKIAWIARTGDVPGVGAADENTPLKIGSTLITCSPHDIVHALDVDTGKQLWSYDPKANSLRPRCRSVGYFVDRTVGQQAPCRERIVLGTIDARLIELDFRTGRRCQAFGDSGAVDLKTGLGSAHPDYYFLTSGPTIVGDLAIVGGTVVDSADVNVPSGVVRAFDARTGELRWFWDIGHPAGVDDASPPSADYTMGTPNAWAPLSVDEKLRLVFVPTGNPSPDHWGGYRTAAMERYGSSVVALDLTTGKPRWSFQTTHHDLWDYDVPAQPTLYDIPDRRGGFIPALIQPTKRGQIFVLDRRTGKPVFPVEERSVPAGNTNGDRTARTQPYSVGMPTISGGKLTEARMWGFSPLDQLWCRIAFRKLRYDGDFTPPGTDASLLYPGVFGGMNWGGASIDEVNGYLIVNDIRLPQVLALVPRAEADRDGKNVLRRFGVTEIEPGHGGFMPQKGTPFAALYFNFMSPLGVPCQAPPYGTLTAIDLRTRKIAWQIPLGTTEDAGPFGASTRLPMPIGMPTIGGSLVTRSGLIFFAGTQDLYLRAIDSSTGREIWKARMPVGAGATPMTYISPRTGRQYVVISASGARYGGRKGDYVIAYALPSNKSELSSAPAGASAGPLR
jgi:quinate dehydrogenase (quinone)